MGFGSVPTQERALGMPPVPLPLDDINRSGSGDACVAAGQKHQGPLAPRALLPSTLRALFVRRSAWSDGARGFGFLIPKLGYIIPKMGIKNQPMTVAAQTRSGIADALFTKVQQRVLAIVYGNSGRSFYANEIIALAGSGTGAVQRELGRLEAAGLVILTRIGNQKHYQANASAPVFVELRGLVLKTCGLADILRAALAPLAGQIITAFVYGSVAKGEDTAKSDIDLMVLSHTLSYADLYAVLEGATNQLGRTANPTLYKPQELEKRVKEGNAFIQRVLAQPKLWLMGDEHELAV